jgi:hypothetical protein
MIVPPHGFAVFGDGHHGTHRDADPTAHHEVAHHDATTTPAHLTGEQLARRFISHVEQVVYHPDPAITAAAQETADNILNHVDHVIHGTPETPHHEAAAAMNRKLLEDMRPNDHSDGVPFGAGTCSHCGGLGKTTWPSSGTVEACWYCGGSGIA